MGCCFGVKEEPSSVALETSKQSLELKSDNTLTLSQGKNDKHTRRFTSTKGMTKLAMQFPYIRKSFKACRSVFDKKATQYNPPDNIKKSDVKNLLLELGAKESNLTDDEMTRIIKISNLDEDDKINFREFLIAAAVGCFLAPTSDKEIEDGNCSESFAANRKGFVVAKEAFDSIDVDKSGEIDYDELKSAFMAMKGHDDSSSHHEQNALIESRLRELDFDGNKQINFPEFVWGITAWVGMDPDGSDDEYLDEKDVDENTTANAGDLLSPKTAIETHNYNEDDQ